MRSQKSIKKSKRVSRASKASKASKVVRSPNPSRPSKGWKKISPRRISVRRQILQKCGPKCFLEPTKLKFPICDADCRIHCAGIDAASVRAGQFKYTKVLKKSKRLRRKLC